MTYSGFRMVFISSHRTGSPGRPITTVMGMTFPWPLVEAVLKIQRTLLPIEAFQAFKSNIALWEAWCGSSNTDKTNAHVALGGTNRPVGNESLALQAKCADSTASGKPTAQLNSGRPGDEAGLLSTVHVTGCRLDP